MFHGVSTLTPPFHEADQTKFLEEKTQFDEEVGKICCFCSVFLSGVIKNNKKLSQNITTHFHLNHLTIQSVGTIGRMCGSQGAQEDGRVGAVETSAACLFFRSKKREGSFQKSGM